MQKFGSGQPAGRLEDMRFVTGRGCFVADIDDSSLARGPALWGHVFRSPVAAARITGIDTTGALASPGVRAVYGIGDLKGVGNLPCLVRVRNRPGTDCAIPVRPVLARDRLRHVGEAILFVVADTPGQAQDAAERIVLDCDDGVPVTGALAALAPGAPQLYPESPGNLAFDTESGDREAWERARAAAYRIATVEVVNNRVVVASMETRGAIADHDPVTGKFTLWTNTQGAHTVRKVLSGVLGIPEQQLRVVTNDVGGGFGMKLFPYPEHVLCLYAARELGRVVRWESGRGEAFLSDTQGRDLWSRGELALDRDGCILGMSVDSVANLGAAVSTYAPIVSSRESVRVLPGIFRVPAIHARTRGVLTNTVPVDAYRGAGRPEANFLMQRLLDAAAGVMGLSPVEIRRRNIIDRFPHDNGVGLVYDCGAFRETFELALEKADVDGFPARRAGSAGRNRLRGLGIANYLEATMGPTGERAEIRFGEDGTVSLFVGTQSTGQGHETSISYLLAEKLGIPVGKIRFVQGDTDLVPTGGGTGGSRSLYVQGAACLAAADLVIDKGRQVAAGLLEARAGDIRFSGGVFRIAGTDRVRTLFEVAAAARLNGKQGLDSVADGEGMATFPNGCHVCEVEIDPETGVSEVVSLLVADDIGTLVNPSLAGGQIHGGVAQGVGQALLERVVHDSNGQQLTAGFSGYAVPRARDLPAIRVFFNENAPCTTNLLGVKGAGEAGCVGSAPAVIAAIHDALAAAGSPASPGMPATAEAIFRALGEGSRGKPRQPPSAPPTG